ncbi:integration host factor, actinobacterial type [Streptomyces ardesiacus]|uniref:integration host factor, actinobacterial type n=1 Tax=Streptomyces ardesiacus TaxID=285564 RepID=UPI0037F67FF4
MALPALTAEARSEALKKAAAVRKERGEILAQLKDGKVSLKEVLEREDTVVGKVYVRRLLKSMPGIGKVRAAQLLDELEISESRRVQGLGARQEERLLELFTPAA